ncbi:MAG: ACP S-malonyltransferase [Planctomycetota bacterium]
MPDRAIVFPGQGAQAVGMGASLLAADPSVKTFFDKASEELGFDLVDVCQNGPAERLNATDVAQVALFVTAVATADALKRSEPELFEGVTATAGLSLGEYTALVFAGAMTFEAALPVVATRGRAMQAAAEASPSGMVSALMLDREQAEAVCAEAAGDGLLVPANYLCPGNTVLSGDKAAVERAVAAIETAGGRPIPLAVAGAFHTDLMQPAVAELEKALADAEIRPPEIPVYSNVDAATHDDPEEIRRLLAAQVVSPVRWEDSVRAMLAAGVGEFVEVGTGRVLTGLLKRIDRKIAGRAVEAPSGG